MKKLFALITAILLVFSVTGCELSIDDSLQDLGVDLGESSSVAGTYTMYKLMDGEEEIDLDSIGATDYKMKIVLNEDKTGVLSANQESFDFTWTRDGDKITLTNPDEEEPIELTVDGDELIAEDTGGSGQKIYFKK